MNMSYIEIMTHEVEEHNIFVERPNHQSHHCPHSLVILCVEEIWKMKRTWNLHFVKLTSSQSVYIVLISSTNNYN